jgi:hypothetical protein
MINIILEILALDDWHGKSPYIDFAKGSHKYHTTAKEIYKQKVRKMHAKKYA